MVVFRLTLRQQVLLHRVTFICCRPSCRQRAHCCQRSSRGHVFLLHIRVIYTSQTVFLSLHRGFSRYDIDCPPCHTRCPPCPPMTINVLACFGEIKKRGTAGLVPRDCPPLKSLTLLLSLPFTDGSANHFLTSFTRRQTKLFYDGAITDFIGHIVIFGHFNYRGL